MGNEVASLVKTLKVDASRPGFVKLDCRDIEWVTTNVRFDHGKNAAKDEPFRIMFNSPAVRTVAPFDWLAFLRQWGCELEEVRIEKGVYFRINGPIKALIGGPTGNPCIYLPDDRTLLFDEESVIRTLVCVAPVTPAYLCGPDWQRPAAGCSPSPSRTRTARSRGHRPEPAGRRGRPLVAQGRRPVDP